MALFDDLIPRRAGGLFDDLVPNNRSEAEPTPFRAPEGQSAPDPLQADGLGVSPNFARSSSVDTTTDARAERGFGRSAYMDDGAGPDLQPNAVSRGRADVAVPTEDDPFAGEGFIPLAKRRGQQAARGATEVVAAIPEASAISSARVERTQVEEAKSLLASRAQQIVDLESRLQQPVDEKERSFVQQQIDDLQIGQEELRKRAAADVAPAGERDRFKRGDSIRQASQDVFGTPDARDTSFWAQVAEGAGNVAGIATASIITGPAGLATGAAVGASLNSSQVYKEAIDLGADEETALKASRFAAAVGASEIIPISRALKLLPPRMRGVMGQGVMKRFADIAQGAGEEAAQEYLATVANNIIAQKLYDPERGWTEGAKDAALVGAVLGGAMGAIGTALEKGGETPASRPPNGDDDPERINSPRLTPSDRDSDLRNDIIDDGKKILDQIASGARPQAGVAPIPEAAPNVITPRPDIVQRPLPTDRLSPTLGAAPEADMPPSVQEAIAAAQTEPEKPVKPVQASVAPQSESRLSEPLPEVDAEGNDTGRMVQVDLDTGETVDAMEGQAADAPVAAPEAAPEAPTNIDALGPVTPDVQPVAAPEVAAPEPKPATGGLQILSNESLTSIEAEPDTFQYKSGGDAEGVTDRLLGVKRWETPRAGQAIVFEYSDGRRVIADGHQRIALAKRLRAEGQDVAMPVTIRRESDGYTPEGVMVEAALKNIAESSATNPDDGAVIDAAKVLRSKPDAINEMNLPQGDKSALGRNARALTNLSADAFGMVVNERASMRSALAVAKSVPDQAAQANILNVVEKSGAKNVFEAEMVAKQAAADTVVQTQDSLFGSEDVTETIYLERARVMDRAIKRLRKEGAAFKTILSNAGSIEGVGKNRVDRDASAQKAAEDSAAQEYITRLSNSKGPISEALTEAARSVKAGGDLGQAVTGFVKAVRSGISEGSGGSAEVAPTRTANEPTGEAAQGTGQDGLFGLETAAPSSEVSPRTKADQDNPSSWVLREKATGEAVLETRDRAKVDALNTEKYEAVPISQHLAELNMPNSKAAKAQLKSPIDREALQARDSRETISPENDTRLGENSAGEAVYQREGGEVYRMRNDRQDKPDGYPDFGGDLSVVEAPTTEPTEAGEQQVIPGAEQSEERSAEARKGDQGHEMEARAQQSRIGTAEPQDAPGGLFDTQSDMFAAQETEAQAASAKEYKPLSKTETRLFNALRDEWSARENLPDAANNDDFVAATQKVAAARKAFADEYGDKKVSAALEKIERDYQSGGSAKAATPNVGTENSNENNQVAEAPKRERIDDIGEKIGGARKDTSTQTGPRGQKAQDERPASQRRYEIGQIAADAFNKERVGKWTISDARSKSGHIPGFGRGKLDFDTREEAEAALPLVAVSRNHRVVADGEGFRIARVVTDRKRPTVKDGFKTREEAMAYMAANAEAIAETKLRIDDNIHPALEEALRVGEQRRDKDRDVTGQDFMDIFGFRGVEFGNWNNNAERQHLLNQAFDAMLDLAEITRMPPKAVSLNGELALAFGARGQGLSGARAHYESHYGVINLTKIKGAGSLAHEWWHAVDHYFGRQDGKAQPRNPNAKEGEPIYAAKGATEDFVSYGFRYKSGMREEVRNEIKNVMAAIMKRKAEYVEDQSSRERVSKRQIERVNSVLDGLEKELSTEQRYGKKKAPASKEQMQRFKRAALKIKAGKDLGDMVDAPTKAQFATYRFYEPVMEIANIYKEVRGRQAYGQQQGRKYGAAVDLQNAIETRNQAQQFLDDAKAEKVKEKTVRSEFYSEAWLMDQGSAKDYWSTNHELSARSFEAFVYDRLKDVDARNDFLSYEKRNDLPEYKLFNVKPYPEGQERADMNAAWQKLFDTITTKEDEGGVMFYQRPLDMFYSPLLKAISSAKQKQAPAQDWKAILGKMPGVKKVELDWLGVEDWLDAQEGQIAREDVAAFVRDSQIEIVEERQTQDGPDSSEITEYDAQEALGDDLILEPDFRIETGEAEWPDDEFFAQEAEMYLDDAREYLEDRLDEDESADDITDADIQERAEEIARENYEPSNYSARLYNYEDDAQSGEPQEYEGFYDGYQQTYFFPDLSDSDLDEYDASKLAHEPIVRAREAQIATKIAEMEAERDERILAESEGLDFTITGQANFENYTEDGGENYREVLLRVPNLHESGKNKPLDDAALRQIVGRVPQNKRPFVQSAHFAQENIVVHARVKDRTGANGEKVLFVEEIQSDLASVWRENQEAPEVTAKRRELSEQVTVLEDHVRYVRESMMESWEKYADDTVWIMNPPTFEGDKIRVGDIEASGGSRAKKMNALVKALNQSKDVAADAAEQRNQGYQSVAMAMIDIVHQDTGLMQKIRNFDDANKELDQTRAELLTLGTEKRMPEGTPDTPFQQEHTYNLMVKRLLRMAAEGGYDRLSWTPGYMQAERWNKAAQSVVEGVEWGAPDTDSIAAAKEGSGTDLSGYRYVYLQMSDSGGKEELTVNPSGKVDNGPGSLEGKQLSQIVGPGLAKQIMTEREGSVSGQKITFSDSGYAIAYDQQTRKAVDKFAKKFGAKVRVDKTLPDFEAGLGAVIEYGSNLSKGEILSRYDTLVESILARDTTPRTEGQARVQREGIARRRANLERGLDAGEVKYALQGLSDNDLKQLFPEAASELSNPVWSIDITPELREAAMEPMAMFRRENINPKRGTALALDGDLSDFRAELDKHGLKEVSLALASPDATYQGALRIDRKGGMTMLIGRSLDVTNTIRHEAIHALRAMNLFTDREWRNLLQAAEGWMEKHGIAERYPEFSRLEQIEEAIAEEYAVWDGKGGGVFDKIKRFFEAMGNFLRGRGFETVDDIFDLTASGEIGARPRDAVSREAIKYQRPPLNAQGRADLAAQTRTPHIPSPGVYSASQQRTNALMRAVSNVKGNAQDKLDRFRRGFQDELIFLRRAEEMVGQERGRKVDTQESTYHAAERYYGRVGFQLDQLAERYVYPIGNLVGRNIKVLSLEDHNGVTRTGAEAVSLYLWARHAKERNARIAKITDQGPTLMNPNPDLEGSGLTDSQADAILQRAGTSPGIVIMERIGKLTDQLGRDMIDVRVNAGLLTAQEGAIWKAQYKHYVPLTGFAETDMYDAVGSGQNAPSAPKFNVTGKESKMATGRKSESFDQLANLIAQAEEVTVRAERNIVGNVMHELIKNNPAPGMWDIKKLETRKVYNKASGRVETQILNANQVSLRSDEMAVKVKGEEVRLKLVDPRLARALGRVGRVDEMDPLTLGSSYFSRYFSSVNTMLNPEFTVVNAFRDLMTAQVLLSSQAPKDLRGKMRLAANPLAPGYWKSLAAARRGSGRGQNKFDGEYGKWFKEFSEIGAKVSFWNIENPQARKDSLEIAVKDETGNMLRRGLRKATSLSTDRNPVLHEIEKLNLGVDNAIRLQVYITGRKNGMTQEDAATLVKNLTVNFNRKGEFGSRMNAWFVFFNAGIQGTHVLAKGVRDSREVQAFAVSMIAMAYALDQLGAALSDEDDDGELVHDKIPSYIGERNLIIPTGQNERITIPLPYGFNAFFHLGTQLSKVWRGVKDPGAATAETAKAFFGGFSPVAGEDVMQTLMPAHLEFGIQLYTNEDWQGRPIRPEAAYGDYGPQSYKDWNVPDWQRSILRFANDATGGSPVEKGLIDISPEYFDHSLEFFLGGMGRFFKNTAETGTAIATGEEVLPYKIPVLRKLRYEPSDFLNQGRYFDFRKEVEGANWSVKQARELQISVSPDTLKASALYGRLRDAEKQRKGLSERINTIWSDDRLTDVQKREKVKPLQDQRNSVYLRFNKEYVRVMGPQAE